MKFIKHILFGVIFIITAHADPSDFVRDDTVYRHGTYDRIWRPQAVYVDKDGSLLYPARDKLQPGDRETIEKFLELYPEDKRQNLELRVYIHPEAPWAKIDEFVTWLYQQKIGKLDLKVASLQKAGADVVE